MKLTARPKADERRATGEGTPMNPLKHTLESRQSLIRADSYYIRYTPICRRCGYPLDSAGHMNGCAE